MKRKNKGKIHPSPSPPPPPPAAAGGRDILSVLNLLPAAVLTIASVLSLQDQEVLAYMITGSLKTPTTTTTVAPATTSSASAAETPVGNKKPYKRQAGGGGHRPPIFNCDCFDCYTAYWQRWDSSPSRELIHQAIEAFEDHLAKESSAQLESDPAPPAMPAREDPALLEAEDGASLPEKRGEDDDDDVVVVELSEELQAEHAGADEEEEKDCNTSAAAARGGGEERRGLIRKMLPDLVGLLNYPFWKLWNPSV